MADTSVKFSVAVKRRVGATPVIPPNAVDDPQNPVNPFPNPNNPSNFVTLDTAQTITGEKTFDARVRVTNNEISITNWVSASGAYDKLSLNLGENRGVGYDPFLNQLFFAGTITVPLKVDTDAPTDSLEILPSGGLKMDNIPTGTPVSSLGLDVNNEVVTSTAITQSFGTFTASLVDSGGGRTYSAVNQNSYYIKTGRFVYLSIYFGSVSSGGGSSTGAFRITGLPFSCSTDVTVPLEAVMTRVTGTTPSLDPKDISPTIASGLPNAISLSGISPPIISGGQIALIISYLTD